MDKARAGRRRRGIGIGLMAVSLGVAGSVLSLLPATAQAEPTPLEVSKTAYYVNSAAKAAPNTLTSEFPPGVLCVVRPELCPEDLRPAFDVVGGVVGQVEQAPPEPVGTVEPGTLPVEVFSGSPHYSSAVQFTLPELSPGNELGRFVLRMEQTQPTFHFSSPAFRQAVLAAVASAGARAPAQEEFEKIIERQPVEREAFLGVEACPVTTPFEAGSGGGQDAADAPEVDCLYGANGIKGEDGVWTFDLSFAAASWYDGTLENQGIYLRSTGAPNLAFGDPDNSTFSRVTFDPATATGELEEQPASSPPAPFTPPPSSSTSGSSGGFSAPSSSGNIFSPPSSFTPEVAQEPAPEAPQVAEDAPAQQPVAAVPFEPADMTTPWWIWLLVPIFLAGMYLTANSLTTEVVLASERRGAMTRLIEQRGGAESLGATAPARGAREGALSRLTGRR